MKRLMVPVVLVAGLAACSSGATGGGQSFATASQLAAKIGCTGYSKDAQDPMAKESGSCSLNGQTVQVYVFASDSARDAMVKAFPGSWAKGPSWALTSPDAGTVKAANAKAGGTTS